MPDHRQPVRFGKRERSQQNSLENTENRNAGADTETEGQDADEEKRRALPKSAEGVTEVLPKIARNEPPSPSRHLFTYLGPVIATSSAFDAEDIGFQFCPIRHVSARSGFRLGFG
jgi:hypothetical protein